jgi:hypothetical protein
MEFHHDSNLGKVFSTRNVPPSIGVDGANAALQRSVRDQLVPGLTYVASHATLSAPMAANSTDVMCFRNCSGGGLFPSKERFFAACSSRSSFEVLMAPKTGSEYLGKSIMKVCPADSEPRAKALWHPEVYTRPCSVVSLREPCARLQSMFGHLQRKYPRARTCHQGGVFTCRKHWFRNVTSVDEFAYAVRDHWDEIRSHDMRIIHSRERKDYVLMQPQHIWVGNLSYVTCQNNLRADTAKLTSDLGCQHHRHFANYTASVDQLKYTNPTNYTSLATHFGNLSAAACRVVRELYWQDELLFSRHCAPSRPST